ncbi:MAG: HDOD domain-containing protein [Acidimicrobiales bacterium]
MRAPHGRDIASRIEIWAELNGDDQNLATHDHPRHDEPRTELDDPDGHADPAEAGRNEQIEGLLQAMEDLPSHPSVALRVLWLVDDPSSDVNRLARTVELDPLLSARLIRISNSAYYSLRSPVTNVPRAITALGFATVRSLAASSACGLTDDETAVSGEFWSHAAAVATAAQLVAGRYGVPSSDAFALGLMHDLGEALLQRAAPAAWSQLAPQHTIDAEVELLGIAHTQACARVLEAWRFPAPFCDSIANHHHNLSPRETPLTRCLIASEVIAGFASDGMSIAKADAARMLLALEGIEGDALDRIVAKIRHETEALTAVLNS